MASIAALWVLNAASKAGAKCEGWIAANGGAWKGVFQSCSSGFPVVPLMPLR